MEYAAAARWLWPKGTSFPFPQFEIFWPALKNTRGNTLHPRRHRNGKLALLPSADYRGRLIESPGRSIEIWLPLCVIRSRLEQWLFISWLEQWLDRSDRKRNFTSNIRIRRRLRPSIARVERSFICLPRTSIWILRNCCLMIEKLLHSTTVPGKRWKS